MPFDANHAGPVVFSGPAPAIAGQRSGALLVLGGARCVWHDLALLPGGANGGGLAKWPGDVMAVNDIAMFLEHPIQHFATLHPEHMPDWLGIRRRRGFDNLRPVETHAVKPGVSHHYWAISPHGSNSAVFGAIAGLLMGYERVLLAGVPLDDAGHFFDPPGLRPLFGRDQAIELEGLRDWFAGRVRGMSGLTRQILGAPQ